MSHNRSLIRRERDWGEPIGAACGGCPRCHLFRNSLVFMPERGSWLASQGPHPRGAKPCLNPCSNPRSNPRSNLELRVPNYTPRSFAIVPGSCAHSSEEGAAATTDTFTDTFTDTSTACSTATTARDLAWMIMLHATAVLPTRRAEHDASREGRE